MMTPSREKNNEVGKSGKNFGENKQKLHFQSPKQVYQKEIIDTTSSLNAEKYQNKTCIVTKTNSSKVRRISF